MEIFKANFYFVDDSFFRKINDPYLKINYDDTKRPHYLAMKDAKTNLFWLVPCSSKIPKYEKLIAERAARNKPNDTIKIVKVQNKKTVLLLQDMFPIRDTYITNQYIKGGQEVKISNPKVVADIERSARKVEILIRKGVKFTPTQPNAIRIEKIMLDEISVERAKSEAAPTVERQNPIQKPKSFAEKLAEAKAKAEAYNKALQSVPPAKAKDNNAPSLDD